MLSTFFKSVGLLTSSTAFWVSGYIAGKHDFPGMEGVESTLSFEGAAAILAVVGAATGLALWKVGVYCESQARANNEGRPLLSFHGNNA